MPLKYNYGQEYGMEYNRPGGDSFNGRTGSQTSPALMNQQTQATKPSSDPYSMFRESARSWYQPPSAQPPRLPWAAQPPATPQGPAQGVPFRPAQPSTPQSGYQPQSQPQEPIAYQKPAMDPANLAGILRGIQPQVQPQIGSATPQTMGTSLSSSAYTPMEMNTLGTRGVSLADATGGILGKTLNRVDDPGTGGGGGGIGTMPGPEGPGGGSGGTGTTTTPPPYQPEIRPVKPGQTPVNPVTPTTNKPPGGEPKPVTIPPTIPREEKPPVVPGSTVPPTPPPTANRELPPNPGLPPVVPNPPAPDTTPPQLRTDPSAWNDVFMPNTPDGKEIMNLLQEMMNPAFKQAQGDLTNVLRGQAALTGDSNAGGFGHVLGREVGSLINSQQAQIADKAFEFDQSARDRALEQYNTDSNRSTERYRIDSDKFIQQLGDDTARYNIRTNADLERYLGDQATNLANRQIDADTLRAYYEAELGIRGQMYQADRAFDRDALNAATQRYIADLNNNLGWGNLQMDQYGIDRDAQIRLISILQQSGLSPAAIQAIITSMIPGYAYTPGG